jgi:type I restriction-modification system DNA methylase subunit
MTGITLKQIKDHIRNRPYMSGVDRDHARVKSTGEVFTPTELVNEIIDKHPQELFADSTKTIIDPAAGDGQFLGEVLIRKIENGIDFETALKTIYGIDIMISNVELCRERLLCGQEHLRHIVEKNIICADALRYHYRFDGTDPYKTRQDLHFDQLFTE